MRRLIVTSVVMTLAACDATPDPHAAAKALIAARCAACHSVPGVRRATGRVGPPLDHMAQRQVIAGRFANTPGNMQRWLMDPQRYMPGGAMPDTGLTADQAHAIAVYLDTAHDH